MLTETYHSRILTALATMLLLGMLCAGVTRPAHAATTFVVNSTADTADATLDGVCDADGGTAGEQCTLRAAIAEANSVTGADTISFDITSGTTTVKTIVPASGLPTITERVTVNGYSQPGASPATATTNASLLIQLHGANAGFDTGFGTIPEEGLVLNNSADGSVIRGLVINAWGDGVLVDTGSENNVIEGNYLGTNAAGNADLGNSHSGVYVAGSNNTVGGTTPAARNVISGNGGIASGGAGVLVSSDAAGNRAQGNYIGTAADGIEALGNSLYGVILFGGSNNTVGGAAHEARNVIAFNGSDGVKASPDAGNHRILLNSVFDNQGLGIDLGQDGVTLNDRLDEDTGPNGLQNYPVLESLRRADSMTTIEGRLESAPNTTFEVQLFSSPAKDPSGFGEGRTYQGGRTDVRTDGEGNANFAFRTTANLEGQFITATAVDPAGNTSEFSEAMRINAPPVADDRWATTDEDKARTITLSATNTDGDPLTFEVTALPTNGRLYKGSSTAAADEISSAGTTLPTNQVTYVPNPDYNGPDSFKFRANDGQANSNEATVSTTVDPINDAPSFDLAPSPDQTVNEDSGDHRVSGFATNIRKGPADESGQSVEFLVSSDNDTLFSEGPEISSDGTLSYTPVANTNGSANITVRLMDDGGTFGDGFDTSAEKTFTITVRGVNDAPVANNDGPYGMDEDASLAVSADKGLLDNDTDPEDDPLTPVVIDGVDHGTLTMNPDGSFTYEPDANYNGLDSFRYKAKDSHNALSNTRTINIAVKPVNDQPTAGDSSETTDEDAPVGIDLRPLVEDIETSDADLTYNIVFGPGNGSLSPGPDNGWFTYSPDANHNGSDSFTYTVTDRGDPDDCGAPGAGCHASATSTGETFTVTVNPQNDPPNADDDSYTMLEDAALKVAAPGILDGDTDAEGDPLTAVEVSGPSHGTVSLNPDGSFVYRAASNYRGTDTFTYKANDGTADGDVATVTITINPVNDDCTIRGTKGEDVIETSHSPGADIICGLGGDDWINAGPGNDTVKGGDGKDTIVGEAGADKLYGEAGNDSLWVRDGQKGNDLANGGGGRDSCTADRNDRKVSCP